jgi:hypothetical protein
VQDLYLRDRIQRHRQIHRVMAGLRVVETHAVQQNECLRKGPAANGEVALNIAGPAAPQIHRGIHLKVFGDGVHQCAIASDIENTDGALRLLERHRFVGAGNDHCLLPDLRLLWLWLRQRR